MVIHLGRPHEDKVFESPPHCPKKL